MASSTRANTPVTRVFAVATDIAHPSVIETFSFKCFAVHVLDAPETACGDGTLCGTLGSVNCGGGAIGVEAETGGGCEGAEEAGDEGWHRGSHEEGEEGLTRHLSRVATNGQPIGESERGYMNAAATGENGSALYKKE